MRQENATRKAALLGGGIKSQNDECDPSQMFDSAAELLAIALSCWSVTYAAVDEEDEEYWWVPPVENTTLRIGR